MTYRRGSGALACALAIIAAGPAQAAVTPVGADAAGATSFGEAVFRNAGILGAPSFHTSPGAGSAGTATTFGTVMPTRGETFGILSTGFAQFADDPNTEPDTTHAFSNALVRGTSSYDATTIALPFTAPAGANCLTMDFQFLSEEFPEYVGSRFNDAFIAELDETTWTTTGTSDIEAPGNFAFDADGEVVSVNAVGLGGFSVANAQGTTYDGATPLLRASKQLTPGEHTLFLSVFDQGDAILDSAAFVDAVRVGFVPNPAVNCKAGAQVANFALDLDPATKTLGIGNEHSVTATLTDEDGNPVAGAPIDFTVSGANPRTGSATTDADGKATYSYTGTKAGDDVIAATYDADGADPAEALADAAATWEDRIELDAEPETGERQVGESHTVTALVTDGSAPRPGSDVVFTVTGANPQTTTVTTGPDGTAALSYVGANRGVDTIVATFDLDGDGTPEASDEVTVEFVNTAPDCSTAAPSVAVLKQNDHKFNAVRISGITDADGRGDHEDHEGRAGRGPQRGRRRQHRPGRASHRSRRHGRGPRGAQRRR
jgi:hypothetical protein